MNKRQSNYYLFLTAIVFMFGSLFSARILAHELVVAAISFPPFYVVEKEGDQVSKISGINVKIVTSVLDAIGEDYQLRYYPAKRLYANMIKGTTHIFYGIRVPTNVVSPDYILHSKQKISKITLRVFYLNTTKPVRDKKDLIGKSIIVFRGYGYGGFINYVKDPRNKMVVHTADTQANGFKMLKKSRADYLLAFERPALATMRTFPKGSLDDVIFSESLYTADGYFVISRKSHDAEELLSKMEKAYSKLLKEGAFEGLIVE